MMSRKTWMVGLWTLSGALLVALACALSPVPAQAQDPIGGALATLAAATANAEAVRAAQRATANAIANEAARQRAIAAATQAAISAEATRQAQQVIATSNAQSAQATQSAIDESNRQKAMTATSQAQSIEATAQALSAEATRNVLDAQATRAAYDLRIAQSRDEARLGRILLYTAAGLSLLGTAYVIVTWARAIGNRLSPKTEPESKAAEPDVIDGEYQNLSESKERMPEGVNFVDDPALTDAIGRWFYGSEAQ